MSGLHRAVIGAVVTVVGAALYAAATTPPDLVSTLLLAVPSAVAGAVAYGLALYAVRARPAPRWVALAVGGVLLSGGIALRLAMEAEARQAMSEGIGVHSGGVVLLYTLAAGAAPWAGVSAGLGLLWRSDP